MAKGEEVRMGKGRRPKVSWEKRKGERERGN